MTRAARRTLLTIAFLVMLMGHTARCEAAGQNALADYSITSWTVRDGVPPGMISALAQDTEGYLWLGTTDMGLVRFDGMHFTEWGGDTLPRYVSLLQATRDGSVWAAFYRQKGLVRIGGRQIVHVGIADGLPDAVVTALVEDATGTLWVGTSRGLYRLTTTGRWSKMEANTGLPDGQVLTATADPGCGLLVVTENGLYLRGTGQTTFHLVEAWSRAQAFRHRQASVVIASPIDVGAGVAPQPGCTDITNRIFINDAETGFDVLSDPPSHETYAESGRGLALLADPDGYVWVATGDNGLWRVGSQRELSARVVVEKSAAFPVEGASSLLKDATGSIWVGSTDTLVRLAPHNFQSITDIGIVTGVEGTPDGDIWAGTADGLFRFGFFGQQWRHKVKYFDAFRVRGLHTDTAGTLWIGTDHGIARLRRTDRVPTLLFETNGLRQIDSVSGDGADGVFVHDVEQGWLHWRAGHVVRLPLPDTLDRREFIASYTDRSGLLWLTFADGRIASVSSEKNVRVFGRANGLDGTVYRTVYQDRTGTLWFGGFHGLSFLSGNQFTSIHTSSRASYSRAMVEDQNGDLWLVTITGLIRFPAREIQESVARPPYQPAYRLYDASDGLPTTFRYIGDRGATRAGNGDLWFVSERGLTIVRPARLSNQHRSSRALINGVVVDDQDETGDAPMSFRPGTRRIEVNYSALNVAGPSKTIFRYRLEGFDREWRDAGRRRQAVYTNLAPGSYRFQVAASTDGGVWDGPTAEWGFSVRPYFYQTGWFLASALLAIAALIYGGWQWRTKHHQKEFGLILQERARLSREIHDTLLQSMAGIALHINDLSKNHRGSVNVLKNRLAIIRVQIEDAISEARRSIWNLRSDSLQSGDLIPALENAGARATAGTRVAFRLLVHGAPLRCPEPVESELLRIAQEALTNAIRHSKPSEVCIELRYDANAITLRVSDDGEGFEPAVNAVADHFGVLVMRERAERLDGEFRVQTAVGKGTMIEAVIPL